MACLHRPTPHEKVIHTISYLSYQDEFNCEKITFSVAVSVSFGIVKSHQLHACSRKISNVKRRTALMPSLYVRYYKMLAATYFGPRRNEKIFPSLFLGLIQNSARSSIVVGKNGSDPTIGSEGIAGGNLRPLPLTLCRR